jgi:carboxylate-amine ligase
MRRRMDGSPSWAVWNANTPPWTVGLEEEVMLLDGESGAAAHRIGDVLAVADGDLLEHLSAETHACVVELKTDPAACVADAVAQQSAWRQELARVLGDHLGLRAAVAGTHPLLHGADVELAPSARYQELGRTMRAVASREPTMALHVHVAVPDSDAAVRVFDGLRHDLPVLLALSANSPFWHGVDSGFSSMRTPILSMFPRMGLPRELGTYRAWIQALDALIAAGAIRDPGYVWWDVRLQPRLGTVEVRVMDAQTRTADNAALAALVQCLARGHAESDGEPHAAPPEVLAENRFLAARDGMRAELIVEEEGRRRPVGLLLDELLERCTPVAAALGCSLELAGAAVLAADPGDDRQRRGAASAGLAALPAQLAAEFVPGARDPVPRPIARSGR